MSSGQITLIDIPSRPPCKCWTPNPWKTRLALNYKGLDYKTEWTEYPDLEPRLSGHVPPNPNGAYGARYTSPTIFLPDGTALADSRAIATALEAAHPTPPLHLASPQLAALEPLMPRVLGPLRAVIVPLACEGLLNEASKPYFRATRHEHLGVSVADLGGSATWAECWEKAKPALLEVSGLLKGAGGPYFMGKEVSYADFVWVGFLLFMKRCGDGAFEGVLETVGEENAIVHEALLKGVEEWAERDDH